MLIIGADKINNINKSAFSFFGNFLNTYKIKFSRKYKLSRVLKFDIPKISGKTLKISKVPVRIK